MADGFQALSPLYYNSSDVVQTYHFRHRSSFWFLYIFEFEVLNHEDKQMVSTH